MERAKYVSGKNYFNENSFNNIVKELEDGNRIEVGIECIGHTCNNIEQEKYKEQLMKRFGDKLKVETRSGNYRYSYIYSLIN